MNDNGAHLLAIAEAAEALELTERRVGRRCRDGRLKGGSARAGMYPD